MKRSWLLSLLLALTLVSLNMPAFAQSDSMEDMNAAIGSLTAKVNALAKQGLAVEVHGFVQQDIINDSTVGFAETVGNGTVAKDNAFGGDNGQTQMSERNSRFDFLAKQSFGGWDTKGYFELDLLGPGLANNYGGAAGETEQKFYDQPIVRMRHAYLQADNDGWSILAGQYWSLFGWNMDYVLPTVTEAPVMGPLYYRVPQLRITKTFGSDKDTQIQLAADIERPDQLDSQVPNIDFGIRWVENDIKGQFCQSTGGQKLMPLSVGLGIRNSLISWDSLASAGGNNLNDNQSVWGSSVAADVLLPVVPASEGKDDVSCVIQGEWTYGAGDTDAFNGGNSFGLAAFAATAGTANTTNLDPGIAQLAAGNFTLVQLESLTFSLQFSLPKSIGTIISLGRGELFSPNVNPAAGATWNDDTCYFVNVMQDFTPSIRAGLEYSTYDTHYLAAFGGIGGTQFNDAIDNRIQLSTWYRF